MDSSEINEKKVEEEPRTAVPEIEHAGPVMKDGLVLHPQPTSDPLDPLNWSSLKKHAILAIVMILYASEPSNTSSQAYMSRTGTSSSLSSRL